MYSQATQGAFTAGVTFIEKTFANLHNWFLLDSRGSTITTAVGEGLSTIPQKIRVLFSWLTLALVATGVLSTIAKYRRTIVTRRPVENKPDYLCSRFEMEYIILTLACSLIVVITVIVPYVSQGYSMERTYFQALAVLSPFFAIESITVARWLKTQAYVIALLVLVPFFMCTTGTMYQVFDQPVSMVLNSAGSEYQLWYVHNQDSHAAQWLGQHTKGQEPIYSGSWPGPRVLESQGMIDRNRTFIGREIPLADWDPASIHGNIYLRYTDINLNSVVEEHPEIFIEKSKIYTTNGSAVYR
ncbi:MAG: DUF2206 domain-containing protein [Dehalococcoidales bacterium]|nr:DUF2206 domain-containing protein [Dehalococcoidales bacterium]